MLATNATVQSASCKKKKKRKKKRDWRAIGLYATIAKRACCECVAARRHKHTIIQYVFFARPATCYKHKPRKKEVKKTKKLEPFVSRIRGCINCYVRKKEATHSPSIVARITPAHTFTKEKTRDTSQTNLASHAASRLLVAHTTN